MICDLNNLYGLYSAIECQDEKFIGLEKTACIRSEL